MLILVRRIIAIPLALLLVPVVGVALASWYLGDVTNDSSFVKDELVRLDVYDYVHESLLPAALDGYLDDEEALPAVLAETLPRDPQSRTVMLDFARDVIPPEFLQRQAEHVADEFWPYLVGSTDSFEIRFALGERLAAVVDHEPGERSALQLVFRELDMGPRVIDAAFSKLDEEPGVSAAERAQIRGALAPDRDAAGEWFTDQFFAVIDGALPYVLGRETSFAVSISLDDQPQLADPLGAFLDRDPDRLLDEGYSYTDADLDALAASPGADGAARVEDEIDRRLSVFREDFVWTEADLLADLRDAQEDAGESGELFITQLRRNVAAARSATWGALLAVIALAAAVGLLGGRRWPTRLIWASAPLVIAAGVWWVISGPVFRAVALPGLRSALAEASSDWSPGLAPLAPHFVSKVELLASDFVGGFESRALMLLAVAGLLLASAVAWLLLAPGSSQDGRHSDTTDESPLMPATPVDSERAA